MGSVRLRMHLIPVFSPQTSHMCPCSPPPHTYTLVALTTLTHQGASNSHSSQLITACLDRGKDSLPEMEALQGKKTVFSAHSCKEREKCPTRLQPRGQQAQTQPCCQHHFGCTYPPLPVPPFLLTQNLSPKTSQDESFMTATSTSIL